MGEARRRGTYEERKATAVAEKEAEDARRAKERADRRKRMAMSRMQRGRRLLPMELAALMASGIIGAGIISTTPPSEDKS